MNIALADVTTNPLPSSAREPLLIVIDMSDARRVWVSNLLTFANYHVYAAPTPLDAFTWHLQHPVVVPQAILLGQILQQQRLFIHRLLQRITSQHGQSIPVVPLATYFPETMSIGIQPSASGCLTLLETLWQMVPRHS